MRLLFPEFSNLMAPEALVESRLVIVSPVVMLDVMLPPEVGKKRLFIFVDPK